MLLKLCFLQLLTKERSSWNSKEFELKSQLTTISVQCKEEQDEKQCMYDLNTSVCSS